MSKSDTRLTKPFNFGRNGLRTLTINEAREEFCHMRDATRIHLEAKQEAGEIHNLTHTSEESRYYDVEMGDDYGHFLHAYYRHDLDTKLTILSMEGRVIKPQGKTGIWY
jgi:hypothetical protein